MIPSLLVFIALLLLSIMWCGFGYGFGYNGQLQIIKNNIVVERGMSIILGLCTIAWAIFLVIALFNLSGASISLLDTIIYDL